MPRRKRASRCDHFLLIIKQFLTRVKVGMKLEVQLNSPECQVGSWNRRARTVSFATAARADTGQALRAAAAAAVDIGFLACIMLLPLQPPQSTIPSNGPCDWHRSTYRAAKRVDSYRVAQKRCFDCGDIGRILCVLRHGSRTKRNIFMAFLLRFMYQSVKNLQTNVMLHTTWTYSPFPTLLEGTTSSSARKPAIGSRCELEVRSVNQIF